LLLSLLVLPLLNLLLPLLMQMLLLLLLPPPLLLPLLPLPLPPLPFSLLNQSRLCGRLLLHVKQSRARPEETPLRNAVQQDTLRRTDVTCPCALANMQSNQTVWPGRNEASALLGQCNCCCLPVPAADNTNDGRARRGVARRQCDAGAVNRCGEVAAASTGPVLLFASFICGRAHKLQTGPCKGLGMETHTTGLSGKGTQVKIDNLI
jgi:hypothetical protein